MASPGWAGQEIKADGSITSCAVCTWLTSRVASTAIVPVFYAYFIGFLGHANGIVDGNQTGVMNLTNAGAALIRQNRAKIVAAYGWYAQQMHTAWPTKPAVWLLEGDYVQYVATSQGAAALSYAELGQLAADITCAIKSNMPNAVVAIDQSSWDADAVTKSYWAAMANVNYDLVWTTGVGNNNGFISAGAAAATAYNKATATYQYLHTLTGRTILVDTSAGISAMGDSWSTATTADISARVSEGVVAALITGTQPTNLQANLAALSGVSGIPGCQ